MIITKKDKAALTFINAVIGSKKIYIAILLLVQMVLGIGNVIYAYFSKHLVDAAVSHEKHEMYMYIVAFVSLVLLMLIFRAVVRFMEEYSKSGFENSFKSRLFNQILRRDYGMVTTVHSGEWMNRLTSDTAVVADGLTTIIPGITGMTIQLIGALGMILFLVPKFGVVLIPAGIFILLITCVFRKRMKTLHKITQEKDGKVRIFLQESMYGLMIIKAFSKETDISNMADERMEEHRSARMKKNRFSNICNTGFGTLMNGVYAFALIYGAYGIYKGTVSYGTLIALIQLVGRIQTPFANITGYMPKYYGTIASTERLMEIEDALEDTVCGEKIETFQAIRLMHGSFSYPDGDQTKVINDFSFELNRGDIVAFTGPSGCGKSTIMKLLMNLYCLDEGKLSIVMGNGDEKNEVMMETKYRNLFAYVPQGNQLMSGSIRDVISFADPRRRDDDDLLMKVLDIACAKDFVNELKDGLDTVLGERGSGLSEGQMQRLAVARALCSERPIILLDESTSALDRATEKRLLQNIKSMTDKTVIIVTHRLQGLNICNRQIEFEGNNR